MQRWFHFSDIQPYNCFLFNLLLFNAKKKEKDSLKQSTFILLIFQNKELKKHQLYL